MNRRNAFTLVELLVVIAIKWISDSPNGVTFQQSTVRIAQMTDGTSKTA